jgi:hypothetical protein
MAGTLILNSISPDVGTNLYLNATQGAGNVVIGNTTTALATFTNAGTLIVGSVNANVTATSITSNTITATSFSTSSFSAPVITANTITANTITVNGFYLNSNTVTSNTTIPTGYNATFAGPMIVANNVIVTAANGARLVIL